MGSSISLEHHGAVSALVQGNAGLQGLELLLGAHIRVLLLVPAVLLPNQLPAEVSGRITKDEPNIWVPATFVGNPKGALGFWFQLRLDLAVTAHSFPALSRSLCLSTKEIYLQKMRCN